MILHLFIYLFCNFFLSCHNVFLCCLLFFENAIFVFGAVLDQIVGYWKIKNCWVALASECVCITPSDIFFNFSRKNFIRRAQIALTV